MLINNGVHVCIWSENKGWKPTLTRAQLKRLKTSTMAMSVRLSERRSIKCCIAMTTELSRVENYSEWNESEMANRIIKYWRSKGVDTIPEVHYNNYGDRGVVDLFTDSKIAIELKSESAVRNSTGANEIIRQFNKMKQNFDDGSDHHAAVYDLYFSPSEYNLHHLVKNAEIYNSIIDGKSRIGVLLPLKNGSVAWKYVASDRYELVKLPNSFYKVEKFVTNGVNHSKQSKVHNSNHLLNLLRGGLF